MNLLHERNAGAWKRIRMRRETVSIRFSNLRFISSSVIVNSVTQIIPTTNRQRSHSKKTTENPKIRIDSDSFTAAPRMSSQYTETRFRNNEHRAQSESFSVQSASDTGLESTPSVRYGSAVLYPFSDRNGVRGTIAVAFGRHQAHTMRSMKRPEYPRRSIGNAAGGRVFDGYFAVH
jgi:hypothetical protein